MSACQLCLMSDTAHYRFLDHYPMTHISIKRFAPTDWTVEERDWGVYA
jgi:hypothetical protein